jgi:hypothetical protein
MSAGDGAVIQRLEIDASLDRRGAEALLLEIRLLARHLGVEIGAAGVEMRAAEPDEEPSSA